MDDIADRFAKMIARGMEIRARLAREEAWRREDERVTKLYEHRTTQQLKEMWDNYAYRDNWEEYWDADIDDVHRALNLRGEGAYCAV